MTNSCNYASVFPSLSQTDMVSSIIEHPWRHLLMCLLICCCTLKDIIFLFVPSDSCSLKTFCSSILLSDKRLNKIVHWVCMSFSFSCHSPFQVTFKRHACTSDFLFKTSKLALKEAQNFKQMITLASDILL